MASLPCACEASGTPHATAAEENPPESDCCATRTQAEREPEPEHDCPHCLTGACEMDGVELRETTVSATALFTLHPTPTAFHEEGYEPGDTPVAVVDRVPALRIADGPPDGWGRCVQNLVIRC